MSQKALMTCARRSESLKNDPLCRALGLLEDGDVNNLTNDEIKMLAQNERDMDSGKQPHVVHEGGAGP